MPVIMNKSAIVASAAFACANADSSSAGSASDVTTTNGFTAQSATGLRVGDNAPETVAGVFQMPEWGNCGDPGTWNACPFSSTANEVDTKFLIMNSFVHERIR